MTSDLLIPSPVMYLGQVRNLTTLCDTRIGSVSAVEPMPVSLTG